MLRAFRRSPALFFGTIVCVMVSAVALAAPLLARHPNGEQRLDLRLKPPAWVEGGGSSSLLGTDHAGRDILSRIILGSRLSLGIGVVATLGQGVLGVALGLIAGYFGGWFDALVMRLADVQWSFPYLLLAMAVIAIVGPSLQVLILVLVFTGWVAHARVIRASVQTLRTQEFVTGAVAAGAGDLWILRRHLMPNLLPSILVLMTFQVPGVILAESSLSFLGLGVQPPAVSWGSMLSQGREYVFTAWWVTAFPGLALTFAVLGMNQLGDGLRDVLDPRLRGTLGT